MLWVISNRLGRAAVNLSKAVTKCDEKFWLTAGRKSNYGQFKKKKNKKVLKMQYTILHSIAVLRWVKAMILFPTTP